MQKKYENAERERERDMEVWSACEEGVRERTSKGSERGRVCVKVKERE